MFHLTSSSSGKSYAPPIFGSLRSLYQKLALLRFSAVQGVITSTELGMDWKQELENKHAEEFRALVKRPQSELLDMLNSGKYGVLGSLLEALSLHGSIKDIGWPLYNALVREENDFNRVACARVLIESMCSKELKVQSFHFLDKTESYESNIEALKNELIKKVGPENG